MSATNSIPRTAAALCFVVAGMLAATLPAHTQTETVLYNFCSWASCTDGSLPRSGLLIDGQGNLYGTTFFGGASNGGEVFRVNPDGVDTVLYSFPAATNDGALPVGGLVADKHGNLYGVTSGGGDYGGGAIFRLSARGIETILYSFPFSGSYNPSPNGDLIMDAKGNLYGTTGASGANHEGTVYELTPDGTEITLYTFGADATDGANPNGGLIMDKQGNLYGTTQYGGANGNGTVFVINPNRTERILYSFNNGTDGARPVVGLVIGAHGYLYGTTVSGGLHGAGTAFSVSPSGNEIILHNFGDGKAGASQPDGRLAMDNQGNLYGTTAYGGAYNWGVAFKLCPFTILHDFGGGADGALPGFGLAIDGNRSLFGTTYYGGTSIDGTIFELTP